MADLKISQLTGATTPLAGTEVLPIVQSSTTKKIATDDLTVKNIRSNATNGILQVAGPAAAATRTMTVPDANFTAARTDAANSFTGDQTLSSGNLVIGTSGKGIDFSATPNTGTSELLDDYEEGTWTPTDASGAGLTFATAAGWYTKVGRLVVATFRIIYPATADASASTFGGLPFASGSGGAQQHQGSGLRFTDANLVFTFANGGGSTEFVPFLYSGAAIANSLFSSKIIDGMVVYQTA
jgi:hypothetical protein